MFFFNVGHHWLKVSHVTPIFREHDNESSNWSTPPTFDWRDLIKIFSLVFAANHFVRNCNVINHSFLFVHWIHSILDQFNKFWSLVYLYTHKLVNCSKTNEIKNEFGLKMNEFLAAKEQVNYNHKLNLTNWFFYAFSRLYLISVFCANSSFISARTSFQTPIFDAKTHRKQSHTLTFTHIHSQR